MDTNISESDIIPGTGGLLSWRFDNPTLLYASRNGHTLIYKAQRMGKWHVLKTLKPELKGDAFYEGLLTKEFETGYRLQHPNICATLSMEMVDGVGRAIVMEYIEGDTLRTLIDEHRLEAGNVVKIIAQTVDAMEYIHTRQIIHRDLKPENIMVTANGGIVKLIDFGYADADSYAVLKQPAGTLQYAAPEQVEGQETVDLRADIYSLGKIIKELIPLAPLSKRLKLMSIARRCTREQRENRYADDAAVRQALNSNLYRLTTLFILVLLGTALVITGRKENGPVHDVQEGNTTEKRVEKAADGNAAGTPATPAASPAGTPRPAATPAEPARPATATAGPEADRVIQQLTKEVREEALNTMKKIDAVEADSTNPKRWTYSSQAYIELQDERIPAILQRRVKKDSPQYVLYYNALKEQAMMVVRAYNKKKYRY